VERIGHYTIVSELGRGGMGVVYKAHEESLNRYVAIKMLGEHLESDEEYVQRFVREAQSAAALSHPNIVQIYSIAEENGHHYFVMEYVQGTSVERIIHDKGKLSPADASRIILQAAAGLQDAHAQGVVHRDIKPANLMVTDRGLVKIADFGLALMGSANTRLTATGMLMGTPGYLSPEQCLDQGPDHRTDIYSLGVTFFQLVTGTMPFHADSPLALLKLIVEVDVPDIGELNPEVDEELRAIITKMLEKDREERYSSATEIITAIQSWLEARNEPLQSTAVGAGSAAGVLPPPPAKVNEDEINTQPTIAVDSGATEEPLPDTPPPPPAPAAPAATSPAPRATAPTTQEQPRPSQSRTGLIVAAVVVFILAGAAVAAVLTIKSGMLDPIFNRGEERVAELEEASTSDTQDPVAQAVGEAELDTESQTGIDEPATVAGKEPANTAIEPAGATSLLSAETAGSQSDTAGPKTARSTSEAPNAASATTGGSDYQSETALQPQILVPPPTGTAVLAVGDRLLAAKAETYVKARLERAGVELVEVTSIPGLEGLINTESRPGPEKFREALRPYARYLVPIRVEYLGSRDIVYMGQRDQVHSARIHVTAVDLSTGRSIGRPADMTVEYTQLNAEEVVVEKLRRTATGLLQKLPRE